MCAVRVVEGASSDYMFSGGLDAFVHRLGKGARTELVALAVEAVGGVSELSNRIGVSRQAIYYFLNDKMHASDRVIAAVLTRVLALASPYYRKRAVLILRREMEEVVKGYHEAMKLLAPDPSPWR